MFALISIIFAGIGMLLSTTLRAKLSKYSQLPLPGGLSGAEIAANMLQHYGISDVRITQVNGQLTDHYNPRDKTVNLSYDVYHGRNVAAAAVAAHECGHAVQHATAYTMLYLRSRIAPIISIMAPIQQYFLMFGVAGTVMLDNIYILYAALIVFGTICLFSLITLPVEFDASRRALAWLDEKGILHEEQYDGAKDALFWAALTYVAAALAALLQFLYLLRFLTNRQKQQG